MSQPGLPLGADLKTQGLWKPSMSWAVTIQAVTVMTVVWRTGILPVGNIPVASNFILAQTQHDFVFLLLLFWSALGAQLQSLS